MARPRIRLLIGDTVALGPGKARLLEAIVHEGSIAAAARAMGMSYGRAWHLVQAMISNFIGPLVEWAAGGRGGGGYSPVSAETRLPVTGRLRSVPIWLLPMILNSSPRS